MKRDGTRTRVSIGRAGRIAAGALCVLMARCVSDYNPFTDSSNVGVYVERRTFADADTVELFSSETLQVSVLVKEQVGRLRVSASGNRTWSQIDTIISAEYLNEDPFRFIVSFYDTGFQYVAFGAENSERALSTDTMRVYVRSPLAQDTVFGAFGDTIDLRTAPVADPGLTYIWSFGAGSDMRARSCSTKAVVLRASESGQGTLVVTDGARSSPPVPFQFRLVDTTGPSIRCEGPYCATGDTLYTADSVFTLRVSITDRGIAGVDSVSVNGEAFDFAYDSLYTKLFTGAHQYSQASPLLIEVFALDRFVNGTASRDTLYLVFDGTAVRPDSISFQLSTPAADISTALAANYTLSGTIASPADSQTVVVELTQNTTVSRDTVRLTEPYVAWNRQAVLSDSITTFVVRLLDSSQADTFSVVTRTVLLDSLLADTTPPRIALIRIVNSNANGHVSQIPRVLLRVNAIDDGVGADSVFINGVAAPRMTTANWWADSIDLVHGKPGATFTVRARDRYGNDTSVTVMVYYDQVPVFDFVPQNKVIGVDTLYRDTMRAIDPDGDALTYSLVSGPAGLKVSGAGAITWTPSVGDTGTHTVVVQAYDGYLSTRHTYLLSVVNLGLFTPVRFAMSASAFPSFVTAGDTMRIRLRVDSSSGVQPYRFSARIIGTDITLLNQSADNLLVWPVDSTLTGSRQLLVIVRDNIGYADTLYPRILVVMPNRPCSLGVRFNSPVLPSGVADLNAYGRPDTLRFMIHDPDDRTIERYTVTLYQSRSRTFTVLDSARADTFRLSIDPRALDGYDTIIATVVDMGGHRDTLVQVLYYGVAPLQPALLSPSLGATGVATPLDLTWQATDPDGDALTFDLYMGLSPGTLAFIASTSAMQYTLPALASSTTYYWQIRASDWKRTTSSAVFNFTTQ